MRAKTTRRKTVSRSRGPQDKRMRNILLGGGAFLGLIGLIALLFVNLQGGSDIRGVQHHAGLSRAHDENIVYEPGELPPPGGVHSGIWQNCGIYDEFVDPKHALHSLEHGAVWITYAPDMVSEQDIAVLENITRRQTYLLLSPYPTQRSPVVLTAWSVQLEVDSANDPRVEQFISRYRLGPQTPERGGACTNGVGQPLS